MESKSKSLTTLHDLLDYELQGITGGELQLKGKLPEWTNQAASLQLKSVLQKYSIFVENHISKLESFPEGENTGTLHFPHRVMEAMIANTDNRLSSSTDTAIRDVCILAGIQQINHFKISLYGTAATFANALEMTDQAGVLHEAEINEKQIDDRLSQLAEHEINIKAISPILLAGEK